MSTKNYPRQYISRRENQTDTEPRLAVSRSSTSSNMIAFALMMTVLGLTQAQSSGSDMGCDPTDSASLASCLQGHLQQAFVHFYDPIELPYFHMDNGQYHLHLRNIWASGVSMPIVDLPEVEMPDAENVHIQIRLNWTEIRASMQARLEYDMQYTSMNIRAWPEAVIENVIGDISLHLGLSTVNNQTVPNLVSGGFTVTLPTEVDVVPYYVDAAWWVYMAVGHPAELLADAIKNEWWPVMQPELHTWLQNFVSMMVEGGGPQ